MDGLVNSDCYGHYFIPQEDRLEELTHKIAGVQKAKCLLLPPSEGNNTMKQSVSFRIFLPLR